MKKPIQQKQLKGRPMFRCPYCGKNYQKKIMCEYHIINNHK